MRLGRPVALPPAPPPALARAAQGPRRLAAAADDDRLAVPCSLPLLQLPASMQQRGMSPVLRRGAAPLRTLARSAMPLRRRATAAARRAPRLVASAWEGRPAERAWRASGSGDGGAPPPPPDGPGGWLAGLRLPSAVLPWDRRYLTWSPVVTVAAALSGFLIPWEVRRLRAGRRVHAGSGGRLGWKGGGEVACWHARRPARLLTAQFFPSRRWPLCQQKSCTAWALPGLCSTCCWWACLGSTWCCHSGALPRWRAGDASACCEQGNAAAASGMHPASQPLPMH